MPRRNSSSLLSPPMLIISLPIIALLLLFFFLHPFLSTTSQIIRPNSVKKSYSLDSINIILVVFAILCGVFAKGNDDGNNNSNTENETGVVKENYDSTPNPQPWFEVSERKVYSDPLIRAEASGGGGRMRRNSSSYPDLRQESLWGNNERFSFFDDFEISKYRSPAAAVDDHIPPLRRWRSEIEEKEIPVDTFLIRSSPPLPLTPPPLQPPQSPQHTAASDHHKRKRTYQSVGRKERVEKLNEETPSPPQQPLHTAETCRHKPRWTHQSVGRKEKVEKGIEQSPSPPQLPPHTEANSRHKPKRTHQSVGRKERVEHVIEKSPPPPPPPPPRPPPSPPVRLAFRWRTLYGTRCAPAHRATSSPAG